MADPGASSADRARGAKGRKRAGAILDAALAVLVSDGYALFSLRSVAAHAGIRLGHLQYYYPAKRELVHAVIERELERRAANLETRVETPARDTVDGFRSLVSAMLDEQQAPGTIELFGELRALAIRDPAIGALMRTYAVRYWRALVRAVVAANPALRRPSAERRAALLVSLLEGLMLFRSPDRPHELPLLGLERELGELSARLLDA